MARMFDMLRDPSEAQTNEDANYKVKLNMAEEIRNLPVRTATSPQDAALYEQAGFVPGVKPDTYVTPQRAQALRMAEREHQKQLAREQLHEEKQNNPFFKIGDTLADTGRFFLSPLFWLSGEDTTKYDPSAVLRSGYQKRFDESVRYTEELYGKVMQAGQLRDKYRETLRTNNATIANQKIQSRFAGMSTPQKELRSFAMNSGPENLALYNAGTSEAFNQLNKNMMLATDRAIPLFGVDGSQIIVPKMINETFNKYGTRFEQAVAPSKEAFSALDKLRAALNEGTPLAEVAAVTQFNKVLDPGSVVRETEVKLTAEARGIYDDLMVKINNVAEGDVLDDQQVIDMLALADSLGAVYEKSYNKTRDDAEFKFTNSGYGDQNVITQYLGSRRKFTPRTEQENTNTITVPGLQPFGAGQGPLRQEFLQQPSATNDSSLIQSDLVKYYR